MKTIYPIRKAPPRDGGRKQKSDNSKNVLKSRLQRFSGGVYFITNNKGKFKEIQKFFQDSPIKIKQLALDLEEIQETDPKKIIKKKAKQALEYLEGDFILEDTSLYIDGLNNLPGPLIKWFLSELGNEGLWKLASKMGRRRARAETIIAYIKSKKEVFYFKGSVRGEIVKPKGKKDFGWGPIFRPLGSQKTFGQMSKKEKNIWSMRAQALKKFKAKLDITKD